MNYLKTMLVYVLRNFLNILNFKHSKEEWIKYTMCYGRAHVICVIVEEDDEYFICIFC